MTNIIVYVLQQWCKGTHRKIGKRALGVHDGKASHQRLQNLTIKHIRMCFCTTYRDTTLGHSTSSATFSRFVITHTIYDNLWFCSSGGGGNRTGEKQQNAAVGLDQIPMPASPREDLGTGRLRCCPALQLSVLSVLSLRLSIPLRLHRGRSCTAVLCRIRCGARGNQLSAVRQSG